MTPIIDLNLVITSTADKPHLIVGGEKTDIFNIDDDGWVDLSILDLAVISDDQDGSESYDILISCTDEKGFSVQPRFNTRASEIDENKWAISAYEAKQVKIYLGEIAEDLKIELTPKSSDGLDSAVGESQVITIKANAVVRRPMLEIKAQMNAFEDELIPILQESGGVVSVVARGSGVGQELYLEISGLQKDTQLIYKDPESNNNIIINRSASGELTDKQRLPIDTWKNTYIKPTDNFNGDISVNVQAFSVGKNGREKETGIDKVKISVIPVNDSPILDGPFNLKSALEGEESRWDIRSLFSDPDNQRSDLSINAYRIEADRKEELPGWLTLDSNGILRGIPNNSDVGALQIGVTATDPLDLKCQVNSIYRWGTQTHLQK